MTPRTLLKFPPSPGKDLEAKTCAVVSRSSVVGIKRERATGPVFRERFVRETLKHVRTRRDGRIEHQVRKNGPGESGETTVPTRTALEDTPVVWRAFLDGLRTIRAAGRTGARFGRVFRLRDKGRLDEALQEGLALAGDLFASASTMDTASIMVAASTVDEIAQRLDRPEAAYDVLARAIGAIEKSQAELVSRLHRKPGDFESLLDSYHRQFRERINAIVSRRNST